MHTKHLPWYLKHISCLWPHHHCTSENNSVFPLSGRAQAPWGGRRLSLSLSRVFWAMASCVSVGCSELHLSELSSTHSCMFSTHLREGHQCLCSITDSTFLSLHHSGPPAPNQKVQANKPEQTRDLIRCEW